MEEWTITRFHYSVSFCCLSPNKSLLHGRHSGVRVNTLLVLQYCATDGVMQSIIAYMPLMMWRGGGLHVGGREGGREVMIV